MKTVIRDIDIIATFNRNLDEIKNGWVYIEDNVVKEVGSGIVPNFEIDKEISGKGMLMLPGFVNTHHHFYQSLFRAILEVQNTKLFDWLIFLYEKWKNIDEEAVMISTVTAILELMKSGVTTTTDHLYLFPKGHPYLFDAQMEGADITGVRFYGTRGSMSLSKKDGGLPPDSVVQTEDEILRDSERVVEEYHDPSRFSMHRVAFIPKVAMLNGMEDFFKLKDRSFSVALEPSAQQNIMSLLKNTMPKKLSIMIGPEGGFSKKEIEMFNVYNIPFVSLNTGIFRSELAGFASALIIRELALNR